MKRRSLSPLFALLVLVVIAPTVEAGTRDQMSILGMVFDNDGNPLNESVDVTFRLYDTPTATLPLWEESQLVTFDEGVYSVSLGADTPIEDTVFDEENLYLGIQIEGDSEMYPRVGVYAVPWSRQAQVALEAQSLTEDAFQALLAQLPSGPQGPQGVTGATGPSGPQGSQGPEGPIGATGPQGPQGETGATGAQGPTGSAGTDGLACWDLDGNGSCDLLTEDNDFSGDCDASDCQGDQGPQGLQGPQGPAGADVNNANYVFAYDTTTQTVATANTFQDVTFNTNGQINGWNHTASTANFTCNQSGLYLVAYTATLQRTSTTGTRGELRALLNGIEVAGSSVGVSLGTNTLPVCVARSMIVNATSGQLLRIQVTGASNTVQLVPGGVNATSRLSIGITFVRIQ